MKTTFLIALCCLAAATVRAADGWQSLFDGQTLTGWTPRIEPVRPDNRPEAEKKSKPVPFFLRSEDQRGKAKFYVADGAIVGHAENYSIHAYLCTDREVDNFELECEVFVGWPPTKMGRLNSGIQIRSKWDETRPTCGRMSGVQVDIDANVPGATGLLYGEGTKPGGWLNRLGPDKKPPAHSHYRLDEWNQLRIVAQGLKIQTYVNGQAVSDVMLDEITRNRPRGLIGLQVHEIGTEKPAEVRWRNLRLRELPAQ